MAAQVSQTSAYNHNRQDNNESSNCVEKECHVGLQLV